ncbi:MAG: asparagine synthase (glutamine-hydrolyzing) [Thermoanaerobaculia bacterium]
MCGISGVVRFDGAPINRDELARLTRALAHRGPDGEGLFFSADSKFTIHDSKSAGGGAVCGLGHRRLAILDPSPAGAQPMTTPDGRYTLVHNGEIYNFKELREELGSGPHPLSPSPGGRWGGPRPGERSSFRSNSDTEVILAAYAKWGADCVRHFQGMFAFAIWDALEQRLFLARDRIGIKPLVYWKRKDRLYFASELQALQALDEPPSEIDPVALDYFLELLYVPAPHTIYSGVRKLPPGSTLTVERDGSEKLNRYWEPRFPTEQDLSEEEWIERLDAAVIEAVRSHLVSDVPVGSFLSSGLDSGLVTSIMAKEVREPVRTFTIRIDDLEYDESRGARAVAEALGSSHTEELFRPRDWDLSSLLVRYGEPFADPSIVPMFAVSRLAAGDVKVVLSGDGGDEIFGGYPWLTKALEAFEFPTSDPAVRAKRFARRLLGRVPGAQRWANPLDVFDRAVSCFDSDSRRSLWRPEWRARSGRPSVIEQSREAIRGLDLCRQIQSLDLTWDLPGDFLTKVDIASMTYGLEVRVPLLDHRLVEICLGLPLDLKYRRENGRLAPRIAEKLVAAKHVPAAVLSAPKRGFGFPLRRWWTPARRRELAARLARPASVLAEYFDPSRLRRYADERASEGGDLKLWALDVLEQWLSRPKGTDPAPAPGLALSARTGERG